MNDNLTYRNVSWEYQEDMCADIYENMLRKNYRPDAIIGLLRGGVVPARLFADYFDITLDFFALDAKLYNGIAEPGEEVKIKPFFGDIKGKKVLIVDDIWDTGETMRAVLKYLKNEYLHTATLFKKNGSEGSPDFYCETANIDEWIIFPWDKRETKRLKHEKEKKNGL